MDKDEKLKLVLEVLEDYTQTYGASNKSRVAIAAIKQALAQPEPMGYAGVKMWVGNQQATQVLTQTEMHWVTTEVWSRLKLNADKCIDKLKEGFV